MVPLAIPKPFLSHLHSTMFLLIQVWKSETGVELSSFTFHNFSINSKYQDVIIIFRYYLHSKMFILISLVKFTFTIHNVSINSNKQAIAGVNYNNLHSTMFLLIPCERPLFYT